MTPEYVLKPFREWYASNPSYGTLPKSVDTLLTLLLKREIATNYASLNHPPESRYIALHPSRKLAFGLMVLFRKLPKIYDPDPAKFCTDLYTLANITEEDVAWFYGLREPIEQYEYEKKHKAYKEEIDSLESTIAGRQAGEDVS